MYACGSLESIWARQLFLAVSAYLRGMTLRAGFKGAQKELRACRSIVLIGVAIRLWDELK